MATYYTKLTPIGRAKVAAAIANEAPLVVTHMALGDGAGNPVPPPTGDETILVREVYRDVLNRFERPEELPEFVEAEMMVSAAHGGWVVREIGLIDIDGDLIAYGNFPAMYKALPSEGSAQDLGFRTMIQVSEDADVTLIIDPNIITATRDWVSNTIDASLQFLRGGTTGQLMRKRSNQDFDAEWFSPDADELNLVFDTVEETQELAENQTVVVFDSVTTNGIGVYVENLRLYRGIHYTVDSDIQITLHQSYPEGSQLLAVQNDAQSGLNDAAEDVRGLVRLTGETDAVEGEDNERAMTSLRTYQQVTARIATQPVAEAGTNNQRLMTPLRTHQQVTARIATNPEMIAGTADKLATAAGVKAKLDQFGINPTMMIEPQDVFNPTVNLNTLVNAGDYYVYSIDGLGTYKYTNGPVFPGVGDLGSTTSGAHVQVRRSGSYIIQRFTVLHGSYDLKAAAPLSATRVSMNSGSSWWLNWVAPEDQIANLNAEYATPGFLRLAGGFLLQWGKNQVAALATVNITLPRAYPTGHLAAWASHDTAASQTAAPGASPGGLTSVTLRNHTSGPRDLWWWSLGYGL